MMVRILPFIFSFLLLSAHFLRHGDLMGLGLSLLAPLVLVVRKPWAVRVARWLCYAGAAVWLHTIFFLVSVRIRAGAPWLRMTLILAGVALFTVYAGYLLRSAPVKRYYRL